MTRDAVQVAPGIHVMASRRYATTSTVVIANSEALVVDLCWDADERLVPWVKFVGQDSFKEGKASITVQSDGSFTWTRLIRKNRGMTGYVSWQTIESNKVFWAKVR